MAKIVNSSSDCTVNMYMECAYNQRYKCLIIEGDATDTELKNAFEIIYAQFIDDSGLFQTAEFEKYGYINKLETRKVALEKFVSLQKSFISQFGVPFISGFEIAAGYGHKLYYNIDQPDIELFKKKLDAILIKETRYKLELKKKKDELFEMQKKKVKREVTLLQSRKEFISLLNKLQQQKNIIDRRVTTIEDVAIMIKDAKAENEEIKTQRQFKTNR